MSENQEKELVELYKEVKEELKSLRKDYARLIDVMSFEKELDDMIALKYT